MMNYFELLHYFATLLFILFITYSFACGLFALAEYAEEYPTQTKKALQAINLVVIALHVIGIVSSLASLALFVGLVAHIVYYCLLIQSFPSVQARSCLFISSCILLIASQYLWYGFFHSYSAGAAESSIRSPTLNDYGGYVQPPPPPFSFIPIQVMSFFGLFVWFVPIAFFVSFSVTEALPLHSTSYNTADHDNGKDKRKQRWSFVRLVNFLRRKPTQEENITNSDSHTGPVQDQEKKESFINTHSQWNANSNYTLHARR